MNLYRVRAENVDRSVSVLVWGIDAAMAVCYVVDTLGLDLKGLVYQSSDGESRELWQYSRDLGEAFAFVLVTFTCHPVKALNPEAVQDA